MYDMRFAIYESFPPFSRRANRGPEIADPDTLDFELWTLDLYCAHGLDTIHHAAARHDRA
jgi:hypothetical protein